MTVVQISTIQIRRGVTTDLPGAPSIPGNSATLTTPLATGEMGFTADTGQVFIGPDPAQSLPNDLRTSFPYQNIEVLTEYSTTTNQNIFNGFYQNIQYNAFQLAYLNKNQTNFTSIFVDVNGNTLSNQLTLNLTKTSIATFNYHIFNQSTNYPYRAGSMRIMIDPNSISSIQPQLVDNNTVYNSDTSISLQFVRSNATTLLFQYKNLNSTNLILRYQIIDHNITP